jgi:hypothetical protein
MDGVFPPVVTAGLATVSGTAGPPTQNDIQAVQQPGAGGAGATPAVAGGEYTVAYTLQTGPIRYAPMPPMAVTSITAQGQSRQFPTSAYTVYPAAAGTPNAITTNTMSITFSVSSIENTVRSMHFVSFGTETNLAGIGCGGWTADRHRHGEVSEQMEGLEQLKHG